MIDSAQIREKLHPFFRRLTVLEQCESTNNFLKQSDWHKQEVHVVIANAQSQGKGRNGKSFYSPKDCGIYCSFIFFPDCDINQTLKMSAAIALAIVQAIEQHYSLTPQIKWINDVLLDNKKIAGILCESTLSASQSKLEYLIIGFGINVHPHVFPDTLSAIATSIENHTPKSISRNKLIPTILNNFYKLYKSDDFMTLYKQKNVLLHQPVTIFTPQETYPAMVLDIDDLGQLVVSKDQHVVTLNSGEISLRISNKD